MALEERKKGTGVFSSVGIEPADVGWAKADHPVDRWNHQRSQRRASSQQRSEAAAAHRESATTGNQAASQRGSRPCWRDAASVGWRPCSGGPTLRNALFRLVGDGRVRCRANGRADGPLWPTLQSAVGWAKADHPVDRWNHQRSQRRASSQQRSEAAAAHRESATTGNQAASQRGSRPCWRDAASVGWRPCSGGPTLRNAPFRLVADRRVRCRANGRADGPLWPTLPPYKKAPGEPPGAIPITGGLTPPRSPIIDHRSPISPHPPATRRPTP